MRPSYYADMVNVPEETKAWDFLVERIHRQVTDSREKWLRQWMQKLTPEVVDVVEKNPLEASAMIRESGYVLLRHGDGTYELRTGELSVANWKFDGTRITADWPKGAA